MHPPLFGLVLAGGASTRMQRDKAALDYHGKTQLQWAYELLSRLCVATFISVRPDQRAEATRARYPQIVDRNPGIGPIAGIAAALQEHRRVAWLVVACDLPFLTPELLQSLLQGRDSRCLATAFRSAHDALPEPLCAIWEPHALEAVVAHIHGGNHCPRKLLINSQVKLLELPDGRALDNVNTVDEYRAARTTLGKADSQHALTKAAEAHARTIRVQYYAILREQARCSEEAIESTASTPRELYSQLRTRHGFRLEPSQLKVAINSEFSDWDAPLRANDRVVFIPPVAGG